MDKYCRRCGDRVPADGPRMHVAVTLSGSPNAESLARFVLCGACASYAQDRLSLQTTYERRGA